MLQGALGWLSNRMGPERHKPNQLVGYDPPVTGYSPKLYTRTRNPQTLKSLNP